MQEHEQTVSRSLTTRAPAPQLQLLNLLSGTWNIEGNNFGDAPGSPDSPVSGRATNAWLAGKFFMTTQWQYQFEKGEHIGYGAFGFNESANNLFVRNYDNLGYERVYEITVYKNTWTFTGEQERATMVFNDARDGYEEEWELLKDGAWKPLCKRYGRKQV